ncbi:pilus assembly protein TadG-related protein [Virgibacillus byunsanensis]|uniref:Pilus assembly protein TadG-related protein n=1 Tax=Virgibacillus byunsanensis TaxID=570945 RepID=A0ABW3LG52_9BACI
MKKLKEIFLKQSGSVLVLVAFAFTGLMGMTGLAIDGGTIYMNKAELQKIANAAVLSGAQELTSEDEQDVRDIVDDITIQHNEQDTLGPVDITMKDSVKVNLNKTVPLSFLKLFGIDTLDVRVDATAGLGVMGRAVGAVPLGVEEDYNFEYGETHFLKVGSGDSDYGEFGILGLDGPGAKTYEETFRNGFDEELAIGDIVNTESGNISGKTSEVVEEKINQCDDMNDRNCARILLVPVYKPYNDDGGKVKQVEITGFAYFYLLDPTTIEADDDTVPGIFIERTGTGFTETGAVNRGAYSIKLTE